MQDLLSRTGQTYTNNGLYVNISTNPSGCTQTDSINLIITTFGTTLNNTVCDSYSWNGNTFNTSGTYYDTSGSCIDTLNLVVNYSSSSYVSIVACDEYVWNGNAITGTGLYLNTTNNSDGCPDYDSLDLTVNKSTFGTDVITACNSYTWIDGVTYTANNDTATYTINGNIGSGISFKINSPNVIAGNYNFSTTADPGVSPAGWTGTPDLNDTANAVMATLMFVEDGTAGINPQGNPISQEGCFPLINDLTGKIAVVWRNNCQFGEKILNAEKAGAVGVIIINREPGLTNMAPC